MPTYDFKCPTHGEFEAFVLFRDADVPQPCPAPTRVGVSQRDLVGVSKPCGKPCKRVARLYPANINYCDGMTKNSAVIDSENTKKYGHCV